MSRKQWELLLAGMALLFIMGISIYRYTSRIPEEESYRLSVFSDSNDHNTKSVLRQGMERASRDFHTDLNFIMFTEEQTQEEKEEIIFREIQRGSQGFLLHLDNPDAWIEKYSHMLEGRVVLALEVAFYDQPDNPSIWINNEKMGYELAMELVKGRDENQNVVLFKTKEHNKKDYLRSMGGKKALEENGIVWEEREVTDNEKENALYLCFNQSATEQTVEMLKDKINRECIFGVGNSEKNVYYLDKGVIHTLAVPDEYMIGYMGVKNICDRLSFRESSQGMEIDYILVSKEELYLPEVQKRMFPILQ